MYLLGMWKAQIIWNFASPVENFFQLWQSLSPQFVWLFIVSSNIYFTLLLVYSLLLLLSHFSCVRLCTTPETAAHPAPPSLGFSRQEHWSGLPFPSPVHESEKWKWSRSVVSDSQRPHGLQPTRLLSPWDFPGKSTGVGCHCLLQYIHVTLEFSHYFFPTHLTLAAMILKL